MPKACSSATYWASLLAKLIQAITATTIRSASGARNAKAESVVAERRGRICGVFENANDVTPATAATASASTTVTTSTAVAPATHFGGACVSAEPARSSGATGSTDSTIAACTAAARSDRIRVDHSAGGADQHNGDRTATSAATRPEPPARTALTATATTVPAAIVNERATLSASTTSTASSATKTARRSSPATHGCEA